jgi:6-phosphogluconolactonase
VQLIDKYIYKLIDNQLNPLIRIFPAPYDLAEAFARELILLIKKAENNNNTFTIALSGGKTPKILFTILGDSFSKSVNWDYVHLFWSDERCVQPENTDSNYGMTRDLLLEKINIPESNIHRIRGEGDPYREARRYSHEIMNFTRSIEGDPVFDQIILGLGEDGHTASIFPGNEKLLLSDKICEAVNHPSTSQKRITLTTHVINCADSVSFLAAGRRKAKVIAEILNNRSGSEKYPAAHIAPLNGRVSWYLDKEAAELIQ